MQKRKLPGHCIKKLQIHKPVCGLSKVFVRKVHKACKIKLVVKTQDSGGLIKANQISPMIFIRHGEKTK